MLINVHLNTALEDGERYDTLVSPSGTVATLLDIQQKLGVNGIGIDEAFPGKQQSREHIEQTIEDNIHKEKTAILFTILVYNAQPTVKYISELRQRYGDDLIIVVGGQLVPLIKDAYVNNSDIDAVCIGDAEVIMPELSNDISSGTTRKTYEGWLKDTAVPNIFSGMSYENYFAIRERMKRQREIAGFSQLVVQGPGGPGCSWAANNRNGACNFCSLQNITTMNDVSLETHFAQEHKLQDTFGPDRFFDAANQFLPYLRKEDVISWLKRYIQVRKRYGVETKKYAYLTVSSIDDEVARLLKEAGIVEVYIGIDHFDPDALKTENKPHKSQTVLERCLNALQNNGISFRTGLVLGAAKETDESLQNVQNGVRWMQDQYGDILKSIVVSPVEIIPGSKIFLEMYQSSLCPNIFKNLFEKGYLTRSDEQELRRVYIENHSEVDADEVFALSDTLLAMSSDSVIMYSYDHSPNAEALNQ